MSAYVTTAELKLLGSMPSEDIDALESRYAGVTSATIVAVSGRFDSRLAKRYASPFQAPYPDSLKLAVAQEVAYRLYLKRGFNGAVEQDQAIAKDHDDAEAWLKEAVDGEKGLVELPVIQATPAQAAAVNVGGPFGYAEASPYEWTDVQSEAVYG